jgi:hypothetical protein
MNMPEAVRLQVRQRANFSCEFCGVTETDAGGELTIDHFRPHSKGGASDPENLLYCCQRCNQYKADYWPTRPDDAQLWNPRQESRETHRGATNTVGGAADVASITIETTRITKAAWLYSPFSFHSLFLSHPSFPFPLASSLQPFSHSQFSTPNSSFT